MEEGHEQGVEGTILSALGCGSKAVSRENLAFLRGYIILVRRGAGQGGGWTWGAALTKRDSLPW
jgi:hypothetical protein